MKYGLVEWHRIILEICKLNLHMNWRNLPSLSSLRAFSAVAENGGYSKAAKQLNVTHAAISQQVKALEVHLGLSLVVREGRGTKLTREGELLARDLKAGFETIRQGVRTISSLGASLPVQITTSPAFAMEWLMPRMPAFQHLHPEITLMLNPSSALVDLAPGGIDLAIRYTERQRLKKSVTPLLVSDMVVIGAPELVGDRTIDDPWDFRRLPWLQELGTSEVTDWFARRGVHLDCPLTISQMPGNLIMQAVRRGDGVTYTVRAFFEEEIQAGKMKVLFSEPAFGVFYIVTAPGILRPAVETFIDWLTSQEDEAERSAPAG